MDLKLDELGDYPVGSPGVRWHVYVRQFPIDCATDGPSKWSGWTLADLTAPSHQECSSPVVSLLSSVEGVPDLLQIHLAVTTCSWCGIGEPGGEPAGFTPFLDNVQLCVDGTIDPANVDSSADRPGASARLSSQPLRRESTVQFTFPATGRVTLGLFDATGRRLAQLFEGEMRSGGEFPLGAALSDRDVSPGVYFLRIHGDRTEESIRIVWRP